MKNQKTYSVLTRLPDEGQRCYCFGHKTYCCKSDMELLPQWHEVTFSFSISSYKLKEHIPEDVEETVLEEYTVREIWQIGPEFTDGHVIGVTEWKPL